MLLVNSRLPRALLMLLQPLPRDRECHRCHTKIAALFSTTMQRRAQGSRRNVVCLSCLIEEKLTVLRETSLPKVDHARALLQHKAKCEAALNECSDPVFGFSCRGFNLRNVKQLPSIEQCKVYKQMDNLLLEVALLEEKFEEIDKLLTFVTTLRASELVEVSFVDLKIVLKATTSKLPEITGGFPLHLNSE